MQAETLASFAHSAGQTSVVTISSARTCILRSAESGQSYSKVHTKATQETCCPGTKAPDLEEDDKFYEDFNMNEVDLNIENYEEIFGVALNDPEQLFGNDGIGCLLGVKDMSDADLNHRGTYAPEGSSIGLVKSMQPVISNLASADSMISSKTDPNLCFATHALSSISFSSLSVERSVVDHQD
ncbi:Zinc finger protein CONSTANS-LIKE 9 [Camellia lanceoleosa]|uniref:Zinc finger protein CONSTANS-LIKE 9 n=1 Tax=Camellia lanceoleosa TaxID=1840588 RepID=A0ACC0I8F4_9ERIC|nr:Zinc finger protein CONSTANS-LIKE 9 [Camellia lanceoleosa]